jgi:hypothetical protein
MTAFLVWLNKYRSKFNMEFVYFFMSLRLMIQCPVILQAKEAAFHLILVHFLLVTQLSLILRI